MTQNRLWRIIECKMIFFVCSTRGEILGKNHVLQKKLTLLAYSIGAKRDLFSKKQSSCTPIILQYLCKVPAESAFKRSRCNVFKNSALPIFLPYNIFTGHVSLRPKNEVYMLFNDELTKRASDEHSFFNTYWHAQRRWKEMKLKIPF